MIDAIIGKQACQNGCCYSLSSLGRMTLETERHPSQAGHQYTLKELDVVILSIDYGGKGYALTRNS